MSVVFQIDASAAEGVKKSLGELQAKTPQVLKNAINSTAKKMRVRMVEQAQKSYTVKKARFNKATTIKNATVRSMTATITAKGEPMELKDFKTSPATPPAKQKRGRSTRARVYSSSQLKPLEKNGIKALIINALKIIEWFSMKKAALPVRVKNAITSMAISNNIISE